MLFDVCSNDLSVSSRRKFIFGAAATAGAMGGLLPQSAFAAARQLPATRQIGFRSIHTGETLHVTHVRDGRYNLDAIKEINYVLRDWRNGEIHPISFKLLDTLSALGHRMGTDTPFEVISAYRSPKTNAMLSKKSTGVAKKSLHMQGQAIDIRLPDRELKALYKGALSLKSGGVGIYSRSGFVHIDTGRVRTWGS
jgi:uncharacterized protein YcbK (DUF882 family)